MAHHGINPENFMGNKGDYFDVADPMKLMHKPTFRKPPMIPNIGATGEFPDGKLTDDDEGEIRIGITEKDNVIVLDFCKPISWIGFTKEQAIQIAQTLIDKANAVQEPV